MSHNRFPHAEFLPTPSRRAVARAWALTLAGLLDRTEDAYHDPVWWAAWIDSALHPRRVQCRPAFPLSRFALQRGADRAPTQEYDLDLLLAALPAARAAMRASYRPAPGGGWLLNRDEGSAYDQWFRLGLAIDVRTGWRTRRGLPLREQVELLLIAAAVHRLPYPEPISSETEEN